MSVKIYPYLAEPGSVTSKTAASDTKNRTLDKDSVSDFQEILAQADRSLKAMAVDLLIAESETGSVDSATVQKLFGFSPAPNPVVVNSKLSSDAAAAGSADSADKANAADSTGAADSAGTADQTDNATGGCTPKMDQYFAEAAALYNIDMNLLKAIARAESNFNPSATSAAGAMGVMQLMPSAASSLGIKDAYNAHDNIMGGAKLIAEYIERYDGDISLALAAYNAGPGNVDKYNGVPPFEETQNYVKKVMDYYTNA